MKKSHGLIIVFSVLILSLAGCAGDARHNQTPMPDPSTFNAHFGDMDKDGDKRVHWEEFKTHFPQATEDIFQELDLNGDGAVNHDEWHEFKEAHGLEHLQ